jgi:hypothetical protein
MQNLFCLSRSPSGRLFLCPRLLDYTLLTVKGAFLLEKIKSGGKKSFSLD